MISVVVPVYNAEKYLPECIESILNSEYKDFELILVNDGSADSSLDICLNYSRKDSRVRVIDGSNRGASAARNTGIENSRGEWVVFVDSDDLVCPDFLTIISRQKTCDLLIFDFSKEKKCPPVSDTAENAPPAAIISLGDAQARADLIEKLLYFEPLSPNGHTDLRAPWAKAFRKSVLARGNIRFTEGIRVGEDALFNIEFITASNSYAYIPLPVYLHRVHTNSVSHKLSPDFLESFSKLQKSMRDVLKSKGLYSRLERAYYANALENIAFMLIRGIFTPYTQNARRENEELCGKILEDEIFKASLGYNGRIGNIPRRIILGLLKARRYGAVKILCRMCFYVLDKRDKKLEKLWSGE